MICILMLISSMHSQNKANWQVIQPGHTIQNGIHKLVAKNNMVYIFDGNHSTLLKSSDKGLNWESLAISSDSTSHEYLDIIFVNDKIGYLAGYDGSLFSGYGLSSVVRKTMDGGLTWKTVKTGIDNHSILTKLVFFDEDYGMAFGTANMKTERFVTYNGGNSWTKLSGYGPYTHQVNSASFEGTEGYVTGIGHYMHVAFTYDGGQSWDTKHFHQSASVTGLKFFNMQNGVIISDDSVFFTNDNANTFASKAKFPFHNVIRDFVMLDMKRGFFSSDKGIYYTNDACQTWTLSYSNPNIQINKMAISDSTIYVSTLEGNLVLKLDLRGSNVLAELESITEVSTYPNPANDQVFIQAPKTEVLKSAILMDQLGRIIKIQNLENTDRIDVKDVKPGSYYLKIFTQDKVYEQKLIIE